MKSPVQVWSPLGVLYRVMGAKAAPSLPWALPAAFSSSYSLGHAVDLLLASPVPLVGRTIPRDEVHSHTHTHKHVPFPQ